MRKVWTRGRPSRHAPVEQGQAQTAGAGADAGGAGGSTAAEFAYALRLLERIAYQTSRGAQEFEDYLRTVVGKPTG